MPPRFVEHREDTERVGLLRLIARALEPPDLHRTDSLPRYAPWGAVILARVVTYVAWALSVALVILVVGVTVLTVGIVAGRIAAAPGVESVRRSQSLGDTFDRHGTPMQHGQLLGVEALQLAR